MRLDIDHVYTFNFSNTKNMFFFLVAINMNPLLMNKIVELSIVCH